MSVSKVKILYTLFLRAIRTAECCNSSIVQVLESIALKNGAISMEVRLPVTKSKFWSVTKGLINSVDHKASVPLDVPGVT